MNADIIITLPAREWVALVGHLTHGTFANAAPLIAHIRAQFDPQLETAKLLVAACALDPCEGLAASEGAAPYESGIRVSFAYAQLDTLVRLLSLRTYAEVAALICSLASQADPQIEPHTAAQCIAPESARLDEQRIH